MTFYLLLFSFSAYGAANDEVKFKPQTYKPRKELNTKPYSEKPYTSSEKAAARPMGEPLSPTQARPPEIKPLVTKGAANGKSLEPPPPMQAESYKHGEGEAHASTISGPNKSVILADKKPYVPKGKDPPSTGFWDWLVSKKPVNTTVTVDGAPFVPAAKPKEKNPLLEPRQGIKILPTDDDNP